MHKYIGFDIDSKDTMAWKLLPFSSNSAKIYRKPFGSATMWHGLPAREDTAKMAVPRKIAMFDFSFCLWLTDGNYSKCC
jgi:hypothetical protein